MRIWPPMLRNKDGQLVAVVFVDARNIGIAPPMVGGITSALLMLLVVFPAVFTFWKEYRLRTEKSTANQGSALIKEIGP